MKIDNLQVEQSVLVAPMAGVTDYPYRQILREMGANLLYTEMVSSKGVIYNNENTKNIINFWNKNSFLNGVQIFGEDPEIMAEAAAFIEEKHKPDIIDINMGCPAPKIVKTGSGAALMKNKKIAGNIIEEVVNRVNIPVTVKMRAGWDQNKKNAPEIAKIAEEKGAGAVTVHGRTRNQFYKGNADWNIIKNVKSAVKIPVIGNGDVFSPELARKMLEETGCDAVMVARGIQGNPWLFKRVSHFIKTGILREKPDYKDKIEMAIYHLQKSVDYYGQRVAIPKMRKHIAWYLKGLPCSTEIKEKINRINNLEKLKKVLQDYLQQLNIIINS